MAAEYLIGLDAGAATLRAAWVSRSGTAGEWRLREVRSQPWTTDADELGDEVLKKAFAVVAGRKWPMRGRAILCLPGHAATARWLEVPMVAEDQRTRLIQFEASQSVVSSGGDRVWDYYPNAGDAGRMEIWLTSVQRSLLRRYCTAAAAAGFHVERVVLPGWCLYQAARAAKLGESGLDLLVAVGARTVQLLRVEGSRFHVRSVALPKESAAVADASASMDGLAARLQLEVTRLLVGQRVPPTADGPPKVWLTGGGAGQPGLAAALSARLRLPVELWRPRAGSDWSEASRRSAVDELSLARIAGMAAGDVDDGAPPYNLLPRPYRRWVRVKRSQPAMVGAAAMVAASLLPPLWQMDHERVALVGKTRAVEAQSRDLSEIKKRNLDNVARITAASEKMAVLKEVLGARDTWVRFFTELQKHVASLENIWLDSLQPAPPHLGAGGPVGPVKLVVAGRLLEIEDGESDEAGPADEKVRRWLDRLSDSPLLLAVDHERFDRSQPGMLRFEVTLSLKKEPFVGTRSDVL